MKSERQSLIDELAGAAMQLAPAERRDFLERHCGDDRELVGEVEARILEAERATQYSESTTVKLVGATDPTASRPGLADFARAQRIGPYRLLRKIGQGGMGTVFLAERDDEFRRQVAIKVVSRGMDSDFIVQRFRTERQILASLDHPNIARLLDGGTTDDGLPYFVMEYIEGKPITEYCRERNLTTTEKLKLFRQVCAAVHYAHQNLIVHRDIKPSNILVTGEGVPKLLDFGIAKLLDPAAGALDGGATAVGMMTPDYASPEQVRGGLITTASDIYSLGVVLYELLTDQRPYHIKSMSLTEIARVVCEEEPQKPSTAVTQGRARQSSADTAPAGRQADGRQSRLRRRLAGDLDNIILMAMRKEPERRYSSADQFSNDIRRHLEGLPVIARKDTFGYLAAKFVQRHKLGIAAALVILVTLVGGFIATARQRARAERRFNDVRQLANSLMFDIHDAIENLPGATPARQMIVSQSLAYLDSLAGEAAGDIDLQAELARSYQKVGDVQGYPYDANLGDTAGALESYRKSQAILEPLVAGNPSNDKIRRDLLITYERLADTLSATGDTAAAVDYQRKSLALAGQLAARNPQDPAARRTLMISNIQMGELLAVTGDGNAALEHYQEALSLAEELLAADPSNAAVQRAATISMNKMGDLLLADKDPQAALVQYRRVLEMRRAMAAADPTNGEIKRDIATSLQKVASALAESGDLAGAMEHQRQVMAIDAELAAADPTNAESQLDLAIGIANLGELAHRANDLKEALGAYRRSAALFEKLAAENPANTELQAEQADTYVRLGRVLAAAGEIDKAFGEYRRGLALYERLTAADAANVELRVRLATLYADLGDAAARRATPAGWREARDWYGRSVGLFGQLDEGGALRAGDRDHFDRARRSLARAEQEAGRAAGRP